MPEKLNKIFGKEKDILIGAIHFPPLPGYEGFPGLDVALQNALKDLEAFEKGGVDAIVIENNYDIPHKTLVDKEVADALEYLATKIKEKTSLPIGISVLWNDYITALTISKKVGLKFVRIPVFVDKVETSYGIMEPKANEVVEFRKSIGAEDVLLFTDIHVKHSKLLSSLSIVESAKLAIEKGSDALIVTGRWTGDAPDLSEIAQVREAVGDFAILCGSGVDYLNVKSLFSVANGAIVSTSVKQGDLDSKQINMKGYDSRIDSEKVKLLSNQVK